MPRAEDTKTTRDTGEADLDDRVLVPQLEPYLGTLDGFLSQGGIDKEETINPILHRNIGHGITVAGRLTNNTDSLPGNHQVNKSLLAIDHELPDIWSGNVVVYGFAEDTERIQDLGLMDFRHLVDIMRHIYDHKRYGCNENVNGPTVIGSFIPCAAEERLGYHVLEIHPVSAAQRDAQSEVASPHHDGELIGWNPALTPLDPTIPLRDPLHGAGSALVVRKDGRPLCQTHVSAFVAYAYNKVVSYCHNNSETARGVLDSCTKEDFLARYDGWKSQASGLEMNVPSPYDVDSDVDLDLTSAVAFTGID
ncbi:hypothetical protein N0V95_008911 [Ascochyta clinopodiicola]|nr:hypothetical protein N0V95_008911 [Ascochyta clinopodiicola]